MFKEEQILTIVNEKIEIFKNTPKGKVPEYTEVYKESVEYYDQISVHTELGKFPEKLFSKRAPNQTPDEFEYMKANYKTTTFEIWTRYNGVLNRIWNDSNWSIKWPEYERLDGENPRDYIETQYPNYGSLEAYYKTIVTPSKSKDSNAVIVHKPLSIPVKQSDNGELVVDQTKRIQPVAKIYESEQVVGFEDGLFCLIELKEKSWVDFGNKKVKEGKIFEFYDQDNIWRVVQVGKKTDYKFICVLYWPHALGYLPVKKLRGIPHEKEDGVLYQSRFMAAVHTMDIVLLDSSYLQASKAGQAFPHKWEYVDECDYQTPDGTRCISGHILVDGEEDDCPVCRGSGYKRKASVLGVTQIKAPTNTDDSAKNIAIPPFNWVAPDPGILEFLRKEIEYHEQKALGILNLSVSTSDVKGDETALGKKIDHEETFSFLQGESQELFDLYEFSHKAILQMGYDKTVELPALSAPKTFAIRTEQDLTEELTKAKEAGLPEIAIRRILQEYLYTRFNDEDTSKMADLAFASDRLISLDSMEISQKRLAGSVAVWEDILHTSIYTFMTELTVEDPTFWEKDVLEQKKLLEDKAKAKEKEITPKQLNPDDILARANGGGV